MVDYQFIAGSSTNDHDYSLKIFGGEILAEWIGNAVLMATTEAMPLPAGADSAQFPAFGSFGPIYHTAGMDLFSNIATGEQGERVVYADRPLVIPTLIDNLQEVLMAAPLRQKYTANFARELSKRVDQNIARVIHDGAAASATYTGGPTGFTKTTANVGLTGVSSDDVYDFIHSAGASFDDDEVPADDRWCAVRPNQYRLLIDAASTGWSSEYVSTDFGAGGSMAEARVPRIGGFNIISTTHLPVDNFSNTDHALDGNKSNDYTTDMTKNAAIAWHRSAVGTVRVMDVNIQTEYQIQYLADMVVAQSILGSALLRPESCARLLFT